MQKKMIVLLFVGIVIEVIGTLLMGVSEGFSRILPSMLVFICYVLAVLISMVVLTEMEVGFYNAVWSGLSTTLVVLSGILFFEESINTLKLVGVIFIIAGILMLNFRREKQVVF
ncbi:multidrug efflux SMR transporter [Geomicrobium sp. JCM 19039]|uniref:DMT family transporter n=1 Tax=Geomicrobium sp. JCM 19039 TaxID=1460636 RepID=UPI00045F3869|nr:SMR family transporter [Geomicrobium sp. JCM 19039]GAK12471.1 ethidium bromide-methyl viologen resistance protein EmrE [Geomicrobium sp. JCM 19039]